MRIRLRLIGAVAALVAIGAVATTLVATANAGDDDRGALKFTVTLQRTAEYLTDVTPLGAAPQIGGPGDYITANYNIFRNGQQVGTAEVFCMFTAGPPQCNVSHQLPEGDLEIQSTNRIPNSFAAAVVGGTGKYRNVGGEVRVEFLGNPEPGSTVKEGFHLFLNAHDD